MTRPRTTATLRSPVLVTGAGGFIGSHLTELLVASGHEVRAFVHYNSRNGWGWLDQSPARAKLDVVAGDIRDFDSVSRAMHECRSVLHLAALIGIPYSYVSPLAYIRTNIEGTYNVLEAARLLKAERVAVTSTSEIYGNAQYVPIDEKHPAVAQSPYAATKTAADELALSYHRSFDLPVHVVRPFNTYGPRQSARAFIPTIVSQILAGERRVKVGNLHPTRDLTFVADTAAGYLAVVGSDACIGSATNVGTRFEITMGDLVRKITDRLGADVEVVTEAQRVRPDGSEVHRLYCDNTKVRTCTGWAPAYDLDRGLDETIAWLKAHQTEYRSSVYTV
jgi:dTDP-glucose 4,6-dehydratase